MEIKNRRKSCPVVDKVKMVKFAEKYTQNITFQLSRMKNNCLGTATTKKEAAQDDSLEKIDFPFAA